MDSVLGLKRVKMPFRMLGCRSVLAAGGHNQCEQPVWAGIWDEYSRTGGASRSFR
jgi:hypothetical protein